MIFSLADAVAECKRLGRIPLCAASSVDLLDSYTQTLHYIVTDQTLDVYESRTKKLRQSESWIKLIQIEYRLNQISLAFESIEIIINTNRAEIMFYAVGHIMRQISNERKFSELGFATVENTGFPAIYRLTQTAKVRNIELPQRFVDAITNIAKFGQSTIDLGEISNYNQYIPQLFDVLPLMKFIDTIKLTNYSKYPNFESYISNISTISNIEFIGKSDNTIVQLLSKLLKSRKIKIKSLSFENTDLSTEELGMISKICENLKITSIGLHNVSRNSDSSNFLSTKFLSPSLMKNITVVNLSGTKHLDIMKILPRIPNVFALSLANTGVEVSDIFEYISHSPLIRLKYLDISENLSTKQIKIDTKLPPTIFCIIANKIKWCGDTFLQFMQMMVGKYPINGLKLSVSKAQVESWDRIFAFLKEVSSKTLSGLNWDKNPLSSSLFEFLQKQPLLSYLSLRGCFSESDSSFVSQLSHFVEISPSLLYLCVRGTSKRKMKGHSCGKLIRSVAKSNVIHFDICQNSISDSGVINLRNLIEQDDKIEVLVFDGSEPMNPHEYTDMLKSALKAKSNLVISYPSEDIEELYRMSKISMDDKQHIFDMLARAVKVREDSFPIPQNSPFIKPYTVFKYYSQPMFPKTLSDEQIELFKSVSHFNSSSPLSASTVKTPRFIQTPRMGNLYDRRFALTPQPSRSIQNPFVSSPIVNRIKDVAESDNLVPHISKSSDSSRGILQMKKELNDESTPTLESNSCESNKSDVFEDENDDQPENQEDADERIDIFRRTSFDDKKKAKNDEETNRVEENLDSISIIAGRDENGNVLPLRPKHRKRKSK